MVSPLHCVSLARSPFSTIFHVSVRVYSMDSASVPFASMIAGVILHSAVGAAVTALNSPEAFSGM